MSKSTQVLVVGGGPAGSTVATFLAREGFDVTLMEKEVFPRYHIGESLLPSCMPILDLLGAKEKVDACGFQLKKGGYFDWGGEQWDISFGDPSEDYSYSYQVVRSDFDQLLLDHAKSQGVSVLEGAEVKRLRFDGARPRTAIWTPVSRDGRIPEQEISFDFLIDASGRAGLMTTRYLRTRRYHDVFKNIAVWGYWKGAKNLPVGPEGAIAICSVPDGWFWGIPLHDGRLSVGLVTHRATFASKRNEGASPDRIYQEAIRECPVITDLLTPAELIMPLRVEQDYSYTSERFTGPGYFLVGDAACFLDPLLSTGVHLATYSALLAAASLASVLRGEVGEEEAGDFYEQTYRQAYLRLLVVVSKLYQQYSGKDSYFWEAQRLTLHDCGAADLKQAFVSVVSGIEDLRDAQATLELAMETAGDVLAEERKLSPLYNKKTLERMLPEERELIQAKVQFFKSLPQEARGLHLVMKPQLGLAHQ
ncbi:MAG: tryptophan 7-halogenase [Pseudonocardiales bacterium]|nr:tryptophan 7-halogenase [Pseudonocardiales bacterium]